MNPENLGVGTLEITQKAIQYINQALKNRRLSYGPFIQRFEKEFAKAHDCLFGVMVNSGTSALSIAVACLKEIGRWKDGDEVIVPAVTFVASANVVLEHTLKPVFVDVDARMYNIDPRLIQKKITKRTRAIIPVHLFGQPCEMEPIMLLARKHGLKVIEDSCEAMFVNYKGRRVGSFGDISCFSTYVAHLIVTGVGGIVVTRNKKYAEILRSLANHGRNNIYISIDDDAKKGKALKEVIAKRFEFVRRGYSFRVTEMEGALGCAQLETADKILEKRQKNAEYLIQKLSPLANYLQLPWHPAYSGHAFMMFPIVIRKDAGVKKRDMVNFLEEKGIETRDMLPLINQPFYRKMFHIRDKDYPVADWINNYGFYIGCHQKMGREELDFIARTVLDFFKKL